jgi:hypothetical protein
MQYQRLINRRIELEKKKQTQLKNKLCNILLIVGIVVIIFGAGYFTAKLQAREARMAAYAEAHGCTWQWDNSGRILPATESKICK